MLLLAELVVGCFNHCSIARRLFCKKTMCCILLFCLFVLASIASVVLYLWIFAVPMEHRQFWMLCTFPGLCLPFTSCLLTYILAPFLPRFGGNCGNVYIFLGWALVKLFELALDIITAKLNLSLATIWMCGVEKEHAHKAKVSKQANSRTRARCYLWALNGQLLQLLMKVERFKTKLCKQFEAAIVVKVLYFLLQCFCLRCYVACISTCTCRNKTIPRWDRGLMLFISEILLSFSQASCNVGQ